MMKLLLTAILLVIFQSQCVEKNKPAITLDQIQKVDREISKPPEFKEIDLNQNFRPNNAVITRFYKSSLKYEEVKEYFNGNLLTNGWQSGEEEGFEKLNESEYRKRISYRKDNFTVFIEYNGLDENKKWNYGVSVSY